MTLKKERKKWSVAKKMQSDSRDRETTTRNPKHYFPTPANIGGDRPYRQKHRMPDPVYNPGRSEPTKMET